MLTVLGHGMRQRPARSRTIHKISESIGQALAGLGDADPTPNVP
ncbi:hypothetical protein [Variovorax saccharolyticus]|nr:hypothetical protein [Variovorax sp. J31P216]MDM0029805.1 hypothetical protein [Variovorax sp. J31P216]